MLTAGCHSIADRWTAADSHPAATAFCAMTRRCSGDKAAARARPSRPASSTKALASSAPCTVCNRDGVNLLGSLVISPQRETIRGTSLISRLFPYGNRQALSRAPIPYWDHDPILDEFSETPLIFRYDAFQFLIKVLDNDNLWRHIRVSRRLDHEEPLPVR
jgi:hypothetical protein